MLIPSLVTKQHKLHLPDEIRDIARDKWVSQQAAKAHQSTDDAPFDRIVDFWFTSALYAAGQDLEPAEKPSSKTSFISLGPNANDIKKIPAWWPALLLLIAVNRWGYDDARCQEPSELVKLANCYADVGSRILIRNLEERTDMGSARLYVLANFLTDTLEGINTTFKGVSF